MRSAAAIEFIVAAEPPRIAPCMFGGQIQSSPRYCRSKSAVTVGIAVKRTTFAQIREANGLPRLAVVPPDQDAEEFELHFPNDVSLDVLTTRDPQGSVRSHNSWQSLAKGVQQVEFRCADVERATQILKERFAMQPIYPQARAGADNTRVNFFLVPSAPWARS